MIFSELYSAYYNAVTGILAELQKGTTDEKMLSKIVSEHAFGESFLTVLPSLKSGKWQLVRDDMTTTLKHPPSMPMTTLQKRWLAAILADPRMKLFDFHVDGLCGVEPLFNAEDYCIYDKYCDGDDYCDPGYIERFRTILHALNSKLALAVKLKGRKGNDIFTKCIPVRLEYSEKDDKFRLFVTGCRFVSVINLARITECHIVNGEHGIKPYRDTSRQETVTLFITDERNALERCMLHFAHFEKRAEKIDDKHYRLLIKYSSDDVSELVIRVLSFGPMVEVTEPAQFRELIKEKLKKQRICGHF